MISGSKCSGSGWSPIGRFSGAGLSSPTDGVVAADARARPGTRWSGGWRTSRSGGGPRCWRSASAATGAPAAGTCGARTRAWLPSHGRSSRAVACGGRWKAIVRQHLTVARVAEGLGVAWNTANDAVLAEGKRVLIDDPHRLDGVKVIGVDEHVWRHTRRGDKYVTVIIDLTPIRDGNRAGAAAGHGRGPLQAGVQDLARRTTRDLARRLSRWSRWTGSPASRPPPPKSCPTPSRCMDPFHVVRLAGDALDRCRRRVQLAIHGHRGRKDDPLYAARRTLHTGADLLTEKQKHRLDALFAAEEHVEVEATWGIYQRMIAAYRQPDRAKGRELMGKLIDSVSHGVPSRTHRDHHPRADPEEARRRRPGLLRPTRHQQRTDRGDQRPPRTPPRLRPRLPQPDELHRQITTRDRRLPTPTTPSIVKSPESPRVHRKPATAAGEQAAAAPLFSAKDRNHPRP